MTRLDQKGRVRLAGMFRHKGRVQIHRHGAVNKYRPLAQSREYVVELNVPDEQIAGAEIMKLWRAEGSHATGQRRDRSVAYIAQAHVAPAEEIKEDATAS